MTAKLTLCADPNLSPVLLPSVSADFWSGGQFIAPHLTRGQLMDLLICLDELGFAELAIEPDSSTSQITK